MGGTLTDDTYIDATGKVFGLKGIPITALTAATASGGAGYSLMVRNEQTGKVEALLASSLIDAGVGVFPVTADVASPSILTTVGFPGLTTVKNRISVFRNGIKLVQTDWAFNGTDATKIDISATADLPIYKDDVIEVQWVK